MRRAIYSDIRPSPPLPTLSNLWVYLDELIFFDLIYLKNMFDKQLIYDLVDCKSSSRKCQKNKIKIKV